MRTLIDAHELKYLNKYPTYNWWEIRYIYLKNSGFLSQYDYTYTEDSCND